MEPHNHSFIRREQLDTWHRSGNVEWIGHVVNMPELLKRILPASLVPVRGVPGLLEAATQLLRPKCLLAAGRSFGRENGLLVPGKNAVALADALRQLIEKTSLRR